MKKKIQYTITPIDQEIITGSVLVEDHGSGMSLKTVIAAKHNLNPKIYTLYHIDARTDDEIEILDGQLVSRNVDYVQIREKSGSLIEATKSKYKESAFEPGSILFEEASRLIEQEEQYMEMEPESAPFVYGVVKVCRLLKCFSYDVFMELNPQIGVVNLYPSKKHWPKKPSLTLPLLLISKIVRLKQTPCFSRKSYMKLISEDGALCLCFHDKDICGQWMNFIKQAIVYSKYFEERTKDFATKPEVKESLRRTNTSRVQLKDSIVTQKTDTIHKSASSGNSIDSQDVFINEKRELIRLQDFEVEKKIGSGSFGYVYLAKHKQTDKKLALKQLSKHQLVQKRQLKYAMTELDILKKAENPFILKLYYAFQTKDYLYMALTYCSNGTLKQLIEANGKLSIEDSLIYLCQLIVAIEYLHNNNILYRDLKPENILIGSDFHLFLSDFGLSKTNVSMKDETESFCGSPIYLSPQMLISGVTTHMSDIYGIGAVFYEMVHGYTMFESSDIGEAFQLIKTAEPKIDQSLPPQVIDFLKRTLSKNPQKRPKRLRQHALFDDVNWKHVMARKMHPSVQYAKQGTELEWVQIDYKIDEDYNHINFLDNRVEGWLFSTKASNS